MAQASPVQPTLLEISAANSISSFHDLQDHSVHGCEFEVSIGLGWLPIQYLSLHANLGSSWFYTFDTPFSYTHHRDIVTGRNLGSINAAVILEAHLPSRLPAIYAELVVKSYFASHRAGIFRTLAGIGISFAPFFEPNSTLRTTQFGLGIRYPLIDDFNKVFGLDNSPPEFNLHVLWGF